MNLSDDRIKELREWVLYNKGWSNKRNDLLSVLDDYAKVKAENEALVKRCEELFYNVTEGEWLAKVESYTKLEAENERLREDCDRTADVVVEQMEELDKLKAELAKQAPLVNALLRIANEAFPLEVTEKCMRSVARAALALREEKK